MPTYDYECRDCKAPHEALQRITEPPLVDCPACKAPALERVITAGGGFRLKGSCWAKDGYTK